MKDILGVEFNLPIVNRILVVGAGKAGLAMYQGVYRVLGDRIKAASITVPRGTLPHNFKHLHLTFASHPIPDKCGVSGTERIIQTLSSASKGDLIICLFSGGGSALMPYPASGISLADKQKITNALLSSGATINEINIVRKHLSSIKGGQLLRHVPKDVTVVSLIISDVISDELTHVASGPTVADPSNFADAMEVINKYDIALPKSVDRHLQLAMSGIIRDTPKPGDPVFDSVHNVLIGNNNMATRVAINHLSRSKIEIVDLGAANSGEASKFGEFLASITSKIAKHDRTLTAIVAGGETTVTLNNHFLKKGGRNQEAALAFVQKLSRARCAVAAFFGTDGIDGNSPVAGALVSTRTLEIASTKSINLKCSLDEHDSYLALSRTCSTIKTGLTGTNVNDISIIILGKINRRSVKLTR